MKTPRIKYAFTYLLIATKRLNVYAQPPWGHQCRKFDAYFVYYEYPISTISFGLTLPFLFCLYVSIGTRCRWWGTNNKPTFQLATFGAWVFLCFRLFSWSLKFGDRSINGEINFRKQT